MPASLTSHLRSLQTDPPYTAATQHPFLREVDKHPLLLALWLYQDRIYASQAYPCFIGSLISHIPFSTTPNSEALNQRILKTLIFALNNITREVDFFDNTAKQWNLDVGRWRERKGTRDYTAEMARISAGRIEEGLIFLWAMERVYLDAWSFVRANISHLDASTSNAAESAAMAFATNWSSPEFVEFVDNLGKLVDSLDIAPDSKLWRSAERIWQRTVELEVGFWPTAGEEVSMRVN